MISNSGIMDAGNSAETFGFLASPPARSYNRGISHFADALSKFPPLRSGTSDMSQSSLYEIPNPVLGNKNYISFRLNLNYEAMKMKIAENKLYLSYILPWLLYFISKVIFIDVY